MKKQFINFIAIPAILILLLSACNPVVKKNVAITGQEIHDHIAYLASDSLKGRFPGEPGGKAAAAYIRQQLLDYGLTPIADNGYQHFQVVTGCTLGAHNVLTINDDSLKAETDFTPIGFSSSMQASGKVVFAGYGFEIENDSLNWNDYAIANVKDKWVMVLREDPESDNMNSPFIPFASDRAKVTLAKDKGAIGVLLVNGESVSTEDKPLELSYDQNLSNAGIPVISITRKTANLLLANSNTIEALEKEIIASKKSIIITIDKEVYANIEVAQHKADVQNVVFELKVNNNQRTARYLVVGAHFDHLGMGGPGTNSRMPDSIGVHHGADDNASGDAGMIEVAGFLNSIKDSLKQNILFVGFDGEEMGTLGSKYFLEHCPVPRNKITAMFNFDMIGRMKSDSIGISVSGTGTAVEFDSLLHLVKPYFNVTFSPDGYGPSDHAPFYSDSIPVLFFTTGAHEDYHTPLDVVEKIKADKESDIVTYASKLIKMVGSTNQPLTFKSTGTPTKGYDRSRLKVTLGIIPDMVGSEKGGLGVDGVRPGGPADRGGMLKGDIITKINNDQVTNIYDYMFRLSKLKAGKTISVEVLRNGAKEVLLIQL